MPLHSQTFLVMWSGLPPTTRSVFGYWGSPIWSARACLAPKLTGVYRPSTSETSVNPHEAEPGCRDVPGVGYDIVLLQYGPVPEKQRRRRVATACGRAALSGGKVGRGTARAEDAQGTPTQSHVSPIILVYEDKVIPACDAARS